MAYCSKEDIVNKYGSAKIGQLTGNPSGQDIDEDVVKECIEAADALIEGYAAKRYSMPFSTVPLIIKNLSRDLAYLELKRSSKIGWSERDERQNSSFLKMLKDIGAGRIEIGADNSTETAAGPAMPFKSNPRTFKRRGTR